MGDARVRELDRLRRVTGSVSDEAASLRERVRHGDLDERHLRLAAHLGHEVARAMVPACEVDAKLPWVEALFGFGRTLGAGAVQPNRWGTRVFTGPAWATTDELADVRREQESGERMIWVRHGQEAMIRAGLACFARLPDLGARTRPCVGPRDLRFVEAAVVTDTLPHGYEPTVACTLPLCADEFVGHRFLSNIYPWLRWVLRAIDRLGEPSVRAVIAAEVVPWALGHGDPLRDRVEGRGP